MNESAENLLSGYRKSCDDLAGCFLGNEPVTNVQQVTKRHFYKRSVKVLPWMLYSVAVLILLTAFYGLGYYTHAAYPKGSVSKSVEWNYCGNTSEEALKKGCILDFIPGAWVHPDCYDKELEEEFLRLKEWHWYYDKEAQHELFEDSIRRTGGPNPIYVSQEYHILHCAYTWKKLHRAVIRQTPIDSHIGSYKHTQHCLKTLTEPSRNTTLPAPSGFYHIFTSCTSPQNCNQNTYPPD
ncbi:hypothetical protein B7463_g9541, partial [Scytalidium lignicola]